MNQKKFDPNEGIVNIPYERQIVQFIDKLVEVARKNGSKNQVSTLQDWQTLEFILKGWMALYPIESARFLKEMKELRNHVGSGVVKEKGAMIQHIANIPPHFYKMMKVIFPLQKWDRKFIDSFIKKFPMFQAHE